MKIKVKDTTKALMEENLIAQLTELDKKSFRRVLLCALKVRRGQRIIEKAVKSSKELYV